MQESERTALWEELPAPKIVDNRRSFRLILNYSPHCGE